MNLLDQFLAARARSRGLSLVRESDVQARIHAAVETAVEDAVSKDKRSGFFYAMKACAKRFPDIKTVVDIGASNGMWSDLCMKFYPSVNYLLIEAQQVHKPALEKFCDANQNCQFALVAAGDREGEIAFLNTDPFGGVASTLGHDETYVKVPMVTVDSELERRNLDGPFLLKFDTHGFETQILAGCQQMLKQTDVIVMECYNFFLTEGSLLFFDMCQHLKERGFRPVDIFDPMYRPSDDALWQIEIVFAREDHPVFQDAYYH